MQVQGTGTDTATATPICRQQQSVTITIPLLRHPVAHIPCPTKSAVAGRGLLCTLLRDLKRPSSPQPPPFVYLFTATTSKPIGHARKPRFRLLGGSISISFVAFAA
jgi:hypothetical protein